MAEFKLGRIKFVWKGSWNSGSTYYIDDVIRYGGRTYICVVGHTSSIGFDTDLNASPTRWNLMSDGQEWRGDWNTSTSYKIGDTVKYGGRVYICTTAHTSAATAILGLEANSGDWDVFADGFDWKNDWAINTRYKVNDIVKYGGYTYVCNTHHTSAANEAVDGLELDSTKWDIWNPGLRYRGDWSGSSVLYKVNDIVKYGGATFVCNTKHISTGSFATANFDIWVEGVQYESDWNSATVYQPGDIVAYGGYSYVAKTVNSNATPSTSSGDWDLFSRGLKQLGNWNNSTAYKVGEVVRLNGYTYHCIQDHTNQEPPSVTYWSLLNSGFKWLGLWIDDFDYKLGDIVQYAGNAYVCVLGHKSEGDDGSSVPPGGNPLSRPDLDVSGTYWNVFTIGNEVTVLTELGDLVYFGGSGPTRLPVGKEGQILKVSSSSTPFWAFYGAIEDVYYVATSGVDEPAPIRGLTLDMPWKTIRYATDQLHKGVKYPDAQKLLEMNRVFIQKEVREWIEFQIAGSIPPFVGFTYNQVKCERDVGFLIDRIIWDMGHGGNLKMRSAAQTYLNVLQDGPYSTLEDGNGTGTYVNLASEADQHVAAFDYMETLINNILDQEAPSVNYQVTNGDLSTEVVAQFTDVNLVAETGAKARAAELLDIVTTAIDTQDPTTIPARIVPNYIVNVKTGTYYETLPIVIPAETAIVGDELRSTNVRPSPGVIDISDAYYTVKTFDRFADIVSNVVSGTTVTPTTGNTETQSQVVPFSYNSPADILTKVEVMKQQADWRLGTMHSTFLTDPTNYNTSYLNGYGDARKLLVENKRFLQAEVLRYLEINYPTLRYGKTRTKRDAGYVIDAVIYDLTYGGNALSVKAGLAYWDGDDTTEPQIPDSIKAATIASLTHLRNIMQEVVLGITVSALQTTIPQYFDTAGSAAAGTLVVNNVNSVITILNTGPSAVGTTVTLSDPNTSWVAGALTTAYSTLSAAFTTIKNNVETYLTTNYPGLLSVANLNKAKRDTEIVLKAVGYDFMFDSNYQTIKAAHAYLRRSSSELFDTETAIKEATRNSLEYARTQAIANVGGNATAISRINSLMFEVDAIFWGGSNEGDICQTENPDTYYAILQLERNRDFIVEEMRAYIADTYSDTATNTTVTTNVITISDTSWLKRNTAIRFTGTTFGNIVADTTYYVQKIVSSTQFTVSLTRDGAAVTLSTAAGSMGVSLYYNQELCLRDVNTYIDALKYDLKYPGNYKSRYVARYYANAVTGSLEEDMFYLRNGTGLRNMTTQGLTGQLEPANEWGTSRTTAGAYASLDPGYGPDDFNAWILARSPYVQNVTTFGEGCIGQKIDGALHAGGNDSIVSNDFTQVLSDGIGAWVTNNGRAELVSVFSYYAHIGYLAENGGKIRATNGNSSYGDYGCVAEGVDASETPNTAVVDNRSQYDATVGFVYTNQNQVQRFEFINAGTNYTEAEWQIFGAGINATAVQDEFRDDGVFEIRLLDFNDSSDQFGGDGYLTNSNSAQSGTTTQITIAATDSEISSAYVGMRIYLTAGTGAGQFGNIATYNSGSKIATVVKESDGTPGWDHVVPGTAIVSPDASTTYTIEPTISLSAPSYSNAARTTASTASWTHAHYFETYGRYAGVTGTTSGSGSSATFNVIRKGEQYIAELVSGGLNYQRLDTVTIAGTSLGGVSPANDLTLTIIRVNSTTGAIVEFDYEKHFGTGGVFVAVSTGGTAADYSTNGTTWLASGGLPSPEAWNSVASGKLTAIETAGSFVTGRVYQIETVGNTDWSAIGAASNTVGIYFTATGAGALGSTGTARPIATRAVAVASGPSTASAYTDNGTTWTLGGALPNANWVDIAYGDGTWVAIATGGTTSAYSTDGGATWTLGGALPASTTWTGIAYGAGVWVAIASGGSQAASSTDNGVTWVTRSLPSVSNWTSVTYGNGRFVAVSATSGTVAAYSLNGTTWTASTLPATTTWSAVSYGQGVFFAVASAGTVGATSEDGISWTSRTVATGSTNYQAVAHGNPSRSGIWVALAGGGATTTARSMIAGARARARCSVAQGKIFEIRVIEPGSAYSVAPTITITDPNNIYEAPTEVRIGEGVLANPSFTNRGTQYTSASATIASGDGYADFYQPGSAVAVKWLTETPVAGSNVVFNNIPGQVYKLVSVTGFTGNGPGSYKAFFTVSPEIAVSDALPHEDDVTTRIRYSQVRLTGHDFLEIGTGNFENTNYPGLPLQPINKTNETRERNGGRVFFTATDQDGNFNVGNLFTVQQSTGIATLNADAFSISGLQELSLGSVSLGSGSAAITEFSTDPFFTANSDNIVPTQRAIKAYISSQIGGGGASLNVNTLIAGSIQISGNTITTTTGPVINVNATLNFTGGVTGLPVAYNYFLR